MLHVARIFVAFGAAECILFGTMTIAGADPVINVKPQIFAPGVISGPAHDSALAFAPDGKTIVFGRSSAAAAFILISHMTQLVFVTGMGVIFMAHEGIKWSQATQEIQAEQAVES